jgi:hypothetical protein
VLHFVQKAIQLTQRNLHISSLEKSIGISSDQKAVLLITLKPQKHKINLTYFTLNLSSSDAVIRALLSLSNLLPKLCV